MSDTRAVVDSTATEVAESVAPGSVTSGDLNGDGRLDVIERTVGEVSTTVHHIAEVVESLAEKADGPAEKALEATGHESVNNDGEQDSSPVALPWTHRKVW